MISTFALVFRGRKCGAFMSPIFRDLHPTCERCRGQKCTADMTCDICKDWLVVQWEAFLKKRSYSERRKARPSGSALPAAPPPLPPSASASSEAGRPSPSPLPSSPPSERRGSWRASPALVLVGSPLPLPPFGGRGRGDPARILASGGECVSAASSLTGVGVAGPSRSQESIVLSRSAPPRLTSLPPLSVIRDHAHARLGALLRATPALTLPEPSRLVMSLGKGDVVPAHGLVGCVPGLASHTLAPRPVRGLVDKSRILPCS